MTDNTQNLDDRPARKGGLTPAKVRRMRRLYAEGLCSYSDLSILFGTSRTNCQHVIYRDSWKSVR